MYNRKTLSNVLSPEQLGKAELRKTPRIRQILYARPLHLLSMICTIKRNAMLIALISFLPPLPINQSMLAKKLLMSWKTVI